MSSMKKKIILCFRFHLCDCMQLEVGGNRQAVVSPCFLMSHTPDLSDVAPREAGADALLHQFGPVRNSDDRMTQPSRVGARA